MLLGTKVTITNWHPYKGRSGTIVSIDADTGELGVLIKKVFKDEFFMAFAEDCQLKYARRLSDTWYGKYLFGR